METDLKIKIIVDNKNHDQCGKKCPFLHREKELVDIYSLYSCQLYGFRLFTEELNKWTNRDDRYLINRAPECMNDEIIKKY